MIGFSIVPDVIDGSGAPSLMATASLREAARLMNDADTEVVAVIDEAGRLTGLIDAVGIVRAIAEGRAGALDAPVAAIARPANDVLAPGDSSLDALDLMRLRAVNHLAVVDSAGRLLGIVSRGRLCALLHRFVESEFDRQGAGVFGEVEAQPEEFP